MRYPGGKGGAGVYQRIINLMPPHRVFIEPFVGGGNIILNKQPAEVSIVIDLDVGQIERLTPILPPAVTAICADAVPWLKTYPWQGDELVYCDPPYVMAARSGRRLYKHEMTDAQHLELVSVLSSIPASVMLSGYRNGIYDELVSQWRRVDFPAMTQGGVKIESIWMNYDPPALPAELTYLGDNFRERERIKRKKARWGAKLAKLPLGEQAAIMDILCGIMSPELTIRPTAAGACIVVSDMAGPPLVTDNAVGLSVAW